MEGTRWQDPKNRSPTVLRSIPLVRISFSEILSEYAFEGRAAAAAPAWSCTSLVSSQQSKELHALPTTVLAESFVS